jgi:hypothetical protein
MTSVIIFNNPREWGLRQHKRGGRVRALDRAEFFDFSQKWKKNPAPLLLTFNYVRLQNLNFRIMVSP